MIIKQKFMMTITALMFLISISLSSASINVTDCGSLSTPDSTYDLTGDLSNKSDTTCLSITADNITLDCHGYAVDGIRELNGVYSSTSSGTGIHIYNNVQNIVVKNCVISGWIDGFDISYTNNSQIYNNTIFDLKGNKGSDGSGDAGNSGGQVNAFGMSFVYGINITDNTIYNLFGGQGGNGDNNYCGGRGGKAYVFYGSYDDSYIYDNTIYDIKGGKGGNGTSITSQAPDGNQGVCTAFDFGGSTNITISFLSGNVPDDNLLNTLDGVPILAFFNKDNISITGYNITNPNNCSLIMWSGYDSTGILLSNVNNSNISDNTIYGFNQIWDYRDYVSGIALIDGSSNNIVSNNVIHDINGSVGHFPDVFKNSGGDGSDTSGILVYESFNNLIYDNSIYNVKGGKGGNGFIYDSGGTGGVGAGLILADSSGNELYSNIFINIEGGDGGDSVFSETNDVIGADEIGCAIWLDAGSYNNKILSFIDGIPDSSKYNYIDYAGSNPILYVYNESNITISGFNIATSTTPMLLGDLSDSISTAIAFVNVTESTINQNYINGFTGASGAVYGGSSGESAVGIYIFNSDNTSVLFNEIENIKGGTGKSPDYLGTGGDGGEGLGVFVESASVGLNLSYNIIHNIIGGDGGNGGYSGNDGDDGYVLSIYLSRMDNFVIDSNNIYDIDGFGEYALSFSLSDDGLISNNIINASDNVTFSSSTNYWNDSLGGNYWTNHLGTGYSDTCTNVDAYPQFCDVQLNITASQIDFLPLAIVPDITIPPQCNDGIDNDLDGDVDFPDDTNCDSLSDTSEFNITNPQCSDGIDNDLDGFTDYPEDIACTSVSDNNESPANYVQCNDGIDNDGDGLIDYPEDPSCISAIDTTESPADYPQCNDGIDNDGDGLIDLDDPRCIYSYTTSEFPSDATIQTEDECYVGDNCILYDSIPYNDNPAYHGWWGDLVNSTADYYYKGGYSLFLDPYDENTDTLYTLVAKKNITNPNNYNFVEAEVIMSIIDNEGEFSQEYGNPLYIYFLDYDQNIIGSLRMNFTDDASYPLVADVYASNYSTYIYVGRIQLSDADDYLVRFYFDFNQLNNKYSFRIDDYGSGDLSSDEYETYSSENIYTIAFAHQLIPDYADVLVQVVDITGSDCSETICTTWSSPYFLKENFNGRINLCDWVTTSDVCFSGVLYRYITDGYYNAFKYTDEITDDITRYATISYDIKPTNISEDGWASVGVFSTDEKFVQLYFGENGEIYNNEDGDLEVVYTNASTTSSKNVEMHIDFTDDDYDLWYDGSKIASSLGFIDSFSNIENIDAILISSQYATYQLDNLQVYATDQNNNIVDIGSGSDAVVDNLTSVCGLFYNIPNQECSQDSDCLTGDCTANGVCNTFNMNYCDENGYTRGTKCVVAGVASCFLDGTTSWILDNFLWFLVIVLIIIGMAYIVYIFKS